MDAEVEGDYESEGQPDPDYGGEPYPIYAENCLVCNQQCYVLPQQEETQRLDPAVKNYNPLLDTRVIMYEAFGVHVDQDLVADNKIELPLCLRCVYKCGQLKWIQNQLSQLQKEYNRMKEEIASSVVDVVASSGASSKVDISDKSPEALAECIRVSEVDTLQQIIFESWQEKYTVKAGPDGYDSYENGSAEDARSENSVGSSKSKGFSKIPGKINGKNVLSNGYGQIGIKGSGIKGISNINPAKRPRVQELDTGDSDDDTRSSQSKARLKVEATVNGDSDTNDDNGGMVVSMSPQNFGYGASDNGLDDEDDGVEEEDEEGEEEFDEESQLSIVTKKPRRMTTDGVTGRYAFSNELEITEWSGSSDESQERMMNQYDPLTDDMPDMDYDDEYASSSSNMPRRTIQRRNTTDDSDSVMLQIGGATQNIEFIKNEEGLYVCMFCTKTFIHKYPYRDHLKTHTGEGPRCPICNKIFPKNHNLMLHMRTHTGEKPYKCSVCTKGFADKSNLKVHMRVHTGERPYRCEYCNHAFVNSSRLVVHRRLHTGEKPFFCNVCQRTFSTSNQLQTHRKSVHYLDTKPFPCDLCSKGYSTSASLAAHMNNFHGVILDATA